MTTACEQPWCSTEPGESEHICATDGAWINLATKREYVSITPWRSSGAEPVVSALWALNEAEPGDAVAIMTPAQAREIAAALLSAADTIETGASAL